MSTDRNIHAVALGTLGGKAPRRPLTEEQRERCRVNGRLSKGPRKTRKLPRTNDLTDRELIALADGAKLIPLTLNKWAIVDAEDYERVVTYTWQAIPGRSTTYARHGTYKNGKPIRILMHRLILNTTLHVDHKDRDGLNNRRSNLRAATNMQNLANSRLRPNNTTGYKGVSKIKSTGRFQAALTVSGKKIHLGNFLTVEQAAEAYKLGAAKYYGEFARLS